LYQKLSKSVNYCLRHTKSNLGSCYTVDLRVISVTATSEQHISKSELIKLYRG